MDTRTRRILLSGADPDLASQAEREALEMILDGRFEEMGLERPNSHGGALPSPAGKEEAGQAAGSSEAVYQQPWIQPTVTEYEEDGQAVERRKKALLLGSGIFLSVLIPRLMLLFVVTDPQNPGLGWYGDTFHHWQIAFLSKEVGFHHGFLRLWDFKGMEYFWGLLHPLVLTWIFSLTGSIDIIIPRLMSAVCAALSLSMVFFLLRRHFNVHVAAAGILFAAFNPVAVFSDSIGMQEPLGLIMLFGGLLLWPRRAAWAGVLWALAGMVRAEYWIFGAGLCVVAMLGGEKSERKMALGLGWAVPSLVYMKYLLDKTGNAIYPVYWNFMGNASGAWMVEAPLTPDRLIARWTARVILFFAIVAAISLVRKQRSSSLFLLLGLGNIVFLGYMWGFSAYIHGFIPRFVYDRLLVVPYMYLGIFIAVLFMHVLPKYSLRKLWLACGWVAILGLLGASQLAWIPIRNYYEDLRPVWEGEKRLAEEIAYFYQGGTIAIPEDRPGLTYALARYHGVKGDNFIGQMYDPFAYYTQPDPFAAWSTSRLVMEDWLEKYDIRLLAFYAGKPNYQRMIEIEPGWFRHLASVNRGTIEVYEVNLQ